MFQEMLIYFGLFFWLLKDSFVFFWNKIFFRISYYRRSYHQIGRRLGWLDWDKWIKWSVRGRTKDCCGQCISGVESTGQCGGVLVVRYCNPYKRSCFQWVGTGLRKANLPTAIVLEVPGSILINLGKNVRTILLDVTLQLETRLVYLYETYRFVSGRVGVQKNCVAFPGLPDMEVLTR